MSGKTKSKALSRRNFLLAASAGGAATVAAVVAGKSTSVDQTPAENGDKRRGKGYQETAHVRSYYSTTKV